MAEKITSEYDEVADIMYVRREGFEGNTVAREHRDEEMVNVLYAEETGEIVGLIITEYTTFVCKYAPQPVRKKITEIVPNDFVRDCYAQFAGATASI